MLCSVLLVVTLAGGCQADSGGSPPPPPAESRRMSAAHVAALRRQLMRDNYDYQHSGDEQKHQSATATSARQRSKVAQQKLNYQRAETDHLSRASDLSQANSKAFSSERGYHQRTQHDRGRQQEQWGGYQQSGEHDHPAHSAQHSKKGQRNQHGQRGQNQQRERRGQQDQRHTQRSVDSAESSLAGRDDYSPAQLQDKRFGDQRGHYNEPYGQDDENDSRNDQREQQLLSQESDSQVSLDQEEGSDEQKSFDQQDSSWSQDNNKQRAINDQFGGQSQQRPRETRTERLRHHMQPSHHRTAPPHRARNSHSYRDENTSPDLSRYELSAPLSADQGAHRRAAAGPPRLPSAERTRRGLLVTVSAANVTYELLTLKTRDGRRRAAQRFVEERGPDGVAIIGLDRPPPPALRLPRAR